MSRTYTVVGVSRTRGDQPYKLRVANGKPKVRQKIMESLGHVDIMLVQVDTPVTKEQALGWLKANYPDLAAQLKAKPVKAAKVEGKSVLVKYGTYLNEPIENTVFPLIKEYTEGTKSGFVTVDATNVIEGRGTIRVRVRKSDIEYLDGGVAHVENDSDEDADSDDADSDDADCTDTVSADAADDTPEIITITDAPLSPAAKAALRRVREASRKREPQEAPAVDTSEVA